jgi:hypothetical protein
MQKTKSYRNQSMEQSTKGGGVMKKESKNFPLEVKIKDNQLIISIGIATLSCAFERSDYANPFDEKNGDFNQILKVVDSLEFAKGVVMALEREEGDGATPIHLLLDSACEAASEDGCEGIDVVERTTKRGQK